MICAWLILIFSGQWNFEVKPSSSAGEAVFAEPIIWVVAGIEKKIQSFFFCKITMICLLLLEPLEVSFVDENGVNKADYMDDGEVGLHIIFQITQKPQVELDSRNHTESVFCKATKVRPAPQFIWTFGEKKLKGFLLKSCYWQRLMAFQLILRTYQSLKMQPSIALCSLHGMVLNILSTWM